MLVAVAAILLTTQFVPPVAALFRFAPIIPAEMGTILLAGLAMLVLLERLKPLWNRRLVE